jgi:hypothetical protein
MTLTPAVGWSDRERGRPLKRNSVYCIRSMTKPFVGATILFFTQSRGARGPWREALRRLPSLVGMEGPVRYPAPRTSGRGST